MALRVSAAWKMLLFTAFQFLSKAFEVHSVRAVSSMYMRGWEDCFVILAKERHCGCGQIQSNSSQIMLFTCLEINFLKASVHIQLTQLTTLLEHPKGNH